MADAKKKGALAIMFGGGEPDGDESGGAPGDGDGDDAFDQACDEMMAAMKSGDKAGFCEAFKAALDLHKTSAPDDEPDGDEAA